jgi:PAS domain S-box-containing protein
MDTRLEKINNLLINYSLGNFDYKMLPTDNFDEIDAFICNINMLGEELKSSMISRDYFNNVFNSVSDMLLVLNKDGIITSVNKTVVDVLKYSSNELHDNHIDFIMGQEQHFFDSIKKEFKTHAVVDLEVDFYSINGDALPVHCLCSYLMNKNHEKIGYLLIVKDLSKIKKYEQTLRETGEKYRKIFQESTDCIFVIKLNGKFLELNQAGINLFKFPDQKVWRLNFFFDFINDKYKKELFKQEVRKNNSVVNFKMKIRNYNNEIIDCLVSTSKINDQNGDVIGFQGIIKDVSRQKETENLVIRTIVDTQEKERRRIVKDLHDSLGQQLSAIKFYLGTLKSVYSDITDPKFQELLLKSNNALEDALVELWNICFNLMPGTLQNFGLRYALIELCKKIEFDNMMKFTISIDKDFPDLDKTLETTIFRIVQEFINNSIKHGEATQIKIQINKMSNEILMILKDNGKGFEVKKLEDYNYMGIGLRNVESRVKSYNGSLRIISAVGSGTRYKIVIPCKEGVIINSK